MMKVSIIIPVYNVDKNRFRKTLDSLKAQTYKNVEICISDGGIKSSVEKIIDDYKNDLDIKYIKSNKNLGISDNTNVALKMANGELISLLDHDDLLYPTAIEESVKKIEEGYDLVYSDEEIVNEKGKIINQFYKPDFSIDLLYSQNYICHLTTIKKELVDKIGLFNSKYDGAQDYDYFLRASELTNKIGHIQKVLYKWLSTEESTSHSSEAKPYAQKAGFNALHDHIERKYGNKATVSETNDAFVYRVDFDILKNELVDIIIPMKDKWSLTKECVDSILEKTIYKNYQITIINNRSEDDITYDWFDDVKKNKRVRVIDADFSFNWSRLQNFGIKNSNADVFVFLNNDTVIIDGNWLNVLCNNALRSEVGVVGPLLLYEDGTIQHAGVVVGLGGYADHIYKGCKPVHSGINYISPMVTRNVLAVTGACMAISKETLDKIGGFDEKFIICGSDVEICIRAYENGLNNIYTPNTRLVHLESKSRDSYIPPIDFKMSEKAYKKYWKNGDPFYNNNLSRDNLFPMPIIPYSISKRTKIKNAIKRIPGVVRVYNVLRRVLRKNKLAVKIYRKIRHIDPGVNVHQVGLNNYIDYTVPEIRFINPIKDNSDDLRINILIPSLNKDKVFGGIATAMKFFSQFDNSINKRIIIVDTLNQDGDFDNYPDYTYVNNDVVSSNKLQITNISDRKNCNLVVGKNDIFIATAWWTAYSIKPIIEWQKSEYKLDNYQKLIYFIQDYEPYFYPWSSKQCCAESTYRMSIPTVGVFNSSELKTYFDNNGYKFIETYSFDPVLNDVLKKHLLEDESKKRKKQIIIYGRPNTPRNAFEIINESLIKAFSAIDDHSWKIISMGELHEKAYVADDLFIDSVGKLTIDEYAKIMEESYLGISLMVSPHPSYPPLEMSTFGVKTITNCFANKDMSYFNNNIISVKNCDAESISKYIIDAVNKYEDDHMKSKIMINKNYLESSNQLDVIAKDIIKKIK